MLVEAMDWESINEVVLQMKERRQCVSLKDKFGWYLRYQTNKNYLKQQQNKQQTIESPIFWYKYIQMKSGLIILLVVSCAFG